jgi:hypothetical protein
MKNTKIMLATLFATLVLLTSAVAQTGTIKAKVPFDFTIAKQTFPAGEYTVLEQNMLLTLVSLDRPGSVVVLSYIADYRGNVTPKLVFHRYGKRSFLSQAWIGSVGHELIASPREIESARTDKQEQVVVLASALPR